MRGRCRYDSRCGAMGFAILLGSATIACSAGSDGGVGYSVRDSAGIQIVESAAPVWPEGRGWQVAPEPVLAIGVLDGPEEYQLFRATSPLLTQRDEIVVANSGSFQLRFYDLEGTYLRAVGREGSGPGEFQRMWEIWRLGQDSLVLYDFGNNRLSVQAIDGTFGRTIRLEQVAATPLPMGVFDDGSILAYWHLVSDAQEEGLLRTPRMYGIWDAEGAFLDSMARLPGSELYAVSMGAEGSLATGRPFGRSPVEIAGGTRWYFGSGDGYEIAVRATDGTLERLIRRPVTNRPVTEDLIQERQRSLRERRAERGITTPNPFDDIPYPADMPAYEEFSLDAVGNLWVQYYRLEEEPYRWAVFDPEGRWLGDVDMPMGGRVSDIGDDYVLGVWADDLGVQQVRMYRLVKETG